MAKQILPQDPFDGQEFIDAFRVRWVYNAEDDTWNKAGVASDVPVARSEDDPEGPTNGLMSAKDKILLDGTKNKGGGFGIILKPGYFLSEKYAADNILTGDVEIVSESLAFDCSGTVEDANYSSIPTVRVGLSQDFLDSYALEIRGPQGPRGDKGDKGRDGRPGTGDGPQGDPGDDGEDATEAHAFTGIKYEELDEIYNSAVVNLRLDAPAGVLEVTKAMMDVPDSDKPARRVAASPVIRGIEFSSTNLDDWQLLAPSDDPASTVDLNIVKLPKGWTGESENPVPVIPVRLTELTDALVNYYKDLGDKQRATWDKQLREWAIELDKAARDALHDQAIKLAECQFEAPLEFCLGIEPQECIGGKLGDVIMIVFIDESSYYMQNPDTYRQDLNSYRTLINSSGVFNSATGAVWMPGGRPAYPGFDVIPSGESDPSEFVISGVGRPPTLEQLVSRFNSLVPDPAIPDNIFLLIDNSGSMSTSTVQPGYGEFVTWLGNTTSANIVEQEFRSERWIYNLNEFLNEVITGVKAT